MKAWFVAPVVVPIGLVVLIVVNAAARGLV